MNLSELAFAAEQYGEAVIDLKAAIEDARSLIAMRVHALNQVAASAGLPQAIAPKIGDVVFVVPSKLPDGLGVPDGDIKELKEAFKANKIDVPVARKQATPPAPPQAGRRTHSRQPLNEAELAETVALYNAVGAKEAAAQLGIKPQTLYHRLKLAGVKPKRPRKASE